MRNANGYNKARDSKRRRPHVPLMAASIALIGIVLAGGILSAAIAGGRSSTNGMTVAVDSQIPAYAHRSPATLAAYQSAVENPGLFEEMPCYCGCGVQADAHRNLKDCFIEPDGSFDQHAAGCATCINIAQDVVALKGKGLTATSIRQSIDAKYGGYGPSTDTPPINSQS